MTKVKGTAIIPLQKFIMERFGTDGYARWQASLPDQARRTFEGSVLSDHWFPLDALFVEPTEAMCRMFFGGDSRGAWELGRFSADFALRGIYRAFVKFGFIKAFIRRAGVMLPAYYQPSAIDVVTVEDNRAVLRISQFPGMHRIVELRIAGWMQRAVEIHGYKDAAVEITRSLTAGDPFTEMVVTWK
jgi:hypothetical protein